MADEPQVAPIQVYLTVKGADAASKFYQKAFGAKENQRQKAADSDRLIHVDMSMFGGWIMFSDEFPEGGHGEVDTPSPITRGGASATVHVNLKSPDEVMRAMDGAAREGARITMPAEKTFWGAYYGRLVDPFGHSWSFAAPAEPPAERPAPARAPRAKPRASAAASRGRAKPAAKKPTARRAASPKRGAASAKRGASKPAKKPTRGKKR
jgi:PhnB protein